MKSVTLLVDSDGTQHVFAVVGVRDGVPYEDPGAEETLGLYASEPAAIDASARLAAARGYDRTEVVVMRVNQ